MLPAAQDFNDAIFAGIDLSDPIEFRHIENRYMAEACQRASDTADQYSPERADNRRADIDSQAPRGWGGMDK